ncbi:MAG: fibrobacter succinogenes major paralogous domain-containing protein [Bacteroidales bacterium]|nr:fibrobacter succinogenes major paralogous domain-containing protein [Bacteroidales bacterium]
MSETFVLNFNVSAPTGLPTVTTDAATNVGAYTAACGGNVTADGGYSVLARGVCWSTSPNPVFNDNHVSCGDGLGAFSGQLTGLEANTTYYVRAYAVNSVGTAYGNQESFTTTVGPVDGQPCPGTPTVTDHQGNIYNTVQIGSQCWTRENMRCTTSPSTGTIILEASPTSYSYTGKKAYYVDGSSSNTSTYGLLYNWNAAVDTFNTAYGETSTNTGSSNAVNVTFSGNRRGICPQGWHVPSDAEWTQLTNYVSSQSGYVCGSNNGNIAKVLASATGWNSDTNTCAVGNNPSGNNAAGFSALPAGCYYGYYVNFGSGAFFWSATQYSSNIAYYRYLFYFNANVYRHYNDKNNGFSVRCLRDGGSSTTLPTVTTTTVTSITQNSATCGGNVTDDGGYSVIARGVCWSTSPNPVFNDSHVSCGDGMGSFTCQITGLEANTTYYVRAYAVNSMGTAYGNQVSFTTTVGPVGGQPCPGAATVTDHQGNIYNTVQIGEQCWTRENMRCTTSPSTGTIILEASPTSYSFTGKKAYYVDGSSSNTSTYGLLYNWNAAVDTFNTAYGETSTNTDYDNAVNVTFSGNRRGICPQGWHVPSDAEWTQLENYVSSQGEYVCESNNTYIAKALASTTGWSSYSSTCVPGNNPSANNATGFSAVAAGDYYGDYNYFGVIAYFWSATQYAGYNAYSRCLYCGDAVVVRSYSSKYYGDSVRCLRD